MTPRKTPRPHRSAPRVFGPPQREAAREWTASRQLAWGEGQGRKAENRLVKIGYLIRDRAALISMRGRPGRIPNNGR